MALNRFFKRNDGRSCNMPKKYVLLHPFSTLARKLLAKLHTAPLFKEMKMNYEQICLGRKLPKKTRKIPTLFLILDFHSASE